ncbi:MAG: glycosyltransferase, partial [Bdellovibrionales bacterium]|nr:glycosyltransferase [Bdellovibrionales bacterium]
MTSNSVKPIKIAHLCPQKSWGGAEIYAVDLADRQKNQGHETVVWATKDSPVHKHCLSLGIPVRTDVPLNRFNLFNLKKMRKAIEEDQITHLHLHWSKLVSSVFGIKWFVPV